MNKKLVYSLALVFILVGVIGLAFRVQRTEASGTIYIRADGSVDPLTANITSSDNVTYYFTDDNYDSIVVQKDSIVIDGAGYKLQGTGSGIGIDLQTNVTVKNMEIVSFSAGVWLSNAENISISGNEIRNCVEGIAFGESWNNTISGNVIRNNTNGIGGSAVGDTIFSGNVITNNTVGIYFSYADENHVYENNITNNDYGIWFSGENVYNNTFYHNNFINNTNQVYIEQTNPNIWDDGYPSGGNYWDDFSDLYPLVGDEYSGSDQNESGSDGIWDGPYEIDGNNTDNYPLTTVIPEFPTWTMTLFTFIVLTAAIAICRRKLSKKPIC